MQHGVIFKKGYMPFLVMLVFIFPFIAIAQQSALMDQTIRFRQTNIELKEVIKTIEQNIQIHFSYDPQAILPETTISLASDMQTLAQVLDLLWSTRRIHAIVHEKVIILQLKKRKNEITATLSGTVRDASTGESLPGAQVILSESQTGVVANHYGFYSLTRPFGKERIEVRYAGYTPKGFDYNFDSDTIADVKLMPETVILKDVTITANTTDRPGGIQGKAGNFIISPEKIREITSFAGEPDAVKALQLLPGVQSGNEGTANLSVRGGSFDQNLFLLDEAPIYNPSHALSFFSVFNVNALQSITLHKGPVPVAYGGRLSSVVDVRMKEGDRTKRSYSGSIGIIASSVTVEGPLSKKSDKTSFMISGRYGYPGPIVNGIYFVGATFFSDVTANNTSDDSKINFHDFNVKVNHRKSEKDHFYLSAYSGHDNFYFARITTGYSLAWGNKTATFRWNRIHSPRIFSNTTAVFSNYDYEYQILNNTQYFRWTARFRELDIKQDYDFFVNNKNKMVFGWGIESHWINPGSVEPRNERAVTRNYSLEKQDPISTYIYAGNEQKVSEKVSFNYGLRYSNYILSGPGTRYFFNGNNDFPYDSVLYSKGEVEKVYHRLDPRLSLGLTSGKNLFTLSYDRTTQYFHLLANSSVGFPTDIWMPSGGSIKPQASNIYAVNYQRPLAATLTGSIGAYYKQFRNILDFKDNANLFVNRYVESQLLQGSGKAYGAELFIQKTGTKLTGSLSYTLSKAANTIVGVNDNKPFPTRYDKRHNLSVTSKVILSKRWEASLNFVYTTGGTLTIPAGSFMFDGVAFNYYTSRNSYRLPDYHRMDISFRYNSKKNDNRKYQSYWSFDVYNVYGQKNPFTVYSKTKDYGFTSTEVQAIYLFKIVPSISYNFRF